MKKLFLSLAIVIAFAASVVGMSAFEAHIINVTATIENALTINTTPIEFGTVFPQEAIDETIDILLSDSFINEDRVDDVNYMIRQKPKCILSDAAAVEPGAAFTSVLPMYGRVTEDESGNFECIDDAYEMLPLLCPFLSKHEITDEEVENDSDGINAFHGPLTGWDMDDTLDTQVLGRLAKSENDILDTWNIDFRVPCFAGQCAQDWEEFVFDNNPLAIAADYILDGELEHALFGCDLWIEVAGISEAGMSSAELACTNSGGTLSTGLCCGAVDAFPNTCGIGACGCAPDSSHEVATCVCPADSCFNGTECVSTLPEPVCGNGIVETTEECDDNNLNNGDGCSSLCETEAVPDIAASCIASGGTLSTGMCCEAVESFPNTCTTGACGCAPDYSHEIETCVCPENSCFNGTECVSDGTCDGVISGYKHDTSQNAIEGWRISLLDHDLSSTTDVVYTNANGYYEFSGLCTDGHYGVYEGLLPGWTFYSPSSGYYYDALIDNQYDFVNEPPIAYAGDIVINEIMPNPDAVSDAYGEWFELYNTTGEAIDLEGCIISDNDIDTHTIIGSLVVPSGGYAVLGNNGDSGVNGGVSVDYVYNGYALANSGDEIVLTCNFLEVDRVEYSSTISGKAMGLADPSLDNSTMTNWCLQSSAFGSGDKGTPGGLNDVCVSTEVVYLSDMGANPQYGYLHDYSNSTVSFTYDTPTSGNLSGNLSASGLKPYATYQVKFEGKPVCAGGSDDLGNENIGYLGRWWNNTDGGNVDDTYYNNNSVSKGGTKCIVGYLVWDFITADASGDAAKTVLANNSYHVLWSGGGTCNTNVNTYLSALDAAHPGVLFSPADKVNGETERFTCDGMTMPSGGYNLKMILTEESFHQSPGTWTSVMNGDIDFVVN